MFEKILVPVDGSENADRALDAAFTLAQKHSSEILILSVVHYTYFETDTMVSYFAALRGLHEEILTKALRRATAFVPQLKVATQLVEGYPIDSIVETAEKNAVDLIVMGRRGRSHIGHTLLGSVSDGVLDKATCSILIVR